ncbi:ABC transporter substrate-binding protein [Vacuolonema iberomarrocanum]|uniref:ABC transporter substrate-binding protein n=1 Tax=Vacuolonema iberomarrocanum TaxID=3454632 RepID=UPI0019FBBE36|nr:ABC transporter substrate-binding protein [filamentous cyanobacterium LEGE 07170]
MNRVWQVWKRRWMGGRSLLSLIFVGVLGLAIVLQGCSPDQFRTAAAQIPRLVISELSDPKTFNTVTNSESNTTLNLIYEGLVGQNGETGELEPGIAESWEISDDQRQILFTLRPDVMWSDGEPLTVDDVVFSFNEIYFNENIPSGERDILRVGAQGLFPTVRKVGDNQVEFIAPEPFAPLLRYAGGIALLPQHALEESVNTTDEAGNPVFVGLWGTETPTSQIISNGPYRIARYQPGERVILERNPHYWRKGDDGSAQPYIERFVLQIVESLDTALVRFRSGGLDVLSIPANFFALVKREEEKGNFTIYNGGPALSTQFLAFNLNQANRNGQPLVDPIKSGWFNTLEFRQAIAHAIDRPTMINSIYQGLGEPQNSPIFIQSPYYLSPEEGLPVYDYDLDQAKALLEQAGFQYNSRGQLEDAEGNIVRFTLITNAGNKIREAMGAQIKQDLARIGIRVDFQPIAFNTLVSKLSDTLDWEAHLLGFVGGSGVEPDGGRNVWSVNGTLHAFNQDAIQGEPLEGRVIQDWEQEINDLYIQGSQQLDEEERRAIYTQTQILAQEYLPFIHLVNPLNLSAVRNDIENVRFSSLGGALWNIHELKLARSS